MNLVYLGLGSNMGDRFAYLKDAIRYLCANDQIQLIRVSSIYETDPYGPVEQSPFLNMVVEIETNMSPLELLQVTQSIEQQLKRERLIHWGPRTIDLDILIYADKIIKMETLIIPHPEMTKRLFVLIPLAELNRSLVIPGRNKSIQDLCDVFMDREGVRLWKQINGADEFEPFES
ncbi:2-amino-4-hydroxy-6-hydroxymethyldihydropteridine diphosphokinase [Pullulanibacillus sp. KACC 23026]|uniref:2-amino-4-hydroxy-6- hydroxymethyldihydropteridine diphosphokinase n=1 Tax=Pullulanibacillus sp. KACC 23026 TaxID=3028315 RepID=UPI0023B03A83|nr:2-amino-4-hydroxy-6-hydroxymethyldihydropteridine diphosphokinase [Pullulanibacillus sp. KACC 23026]WEG12706.1 2-amino-4-hydroxy-6-hydroxymethyldihydropteridine diphosphokinase [Pullulanibacillus sp. KACC 23026]